MGLFESLGASVKAVAASLTPAGNTPFSNWGTGLSGFSSASGYIATGANDVPLASTPGSRDDYSVDIGDPGLNGVVSACTSAISEAFCSAPLVLEQRKGDAWNRVEMHPCIELLRNPNPFYGSQQLWEAEIAGELLTGNGFIRAVLNRARTQPVELWHESLIGPVFDSRTFISSYRVFVDGRGYPNGAAALYGKPDDPYKGTPVDYALHFRYRLNRQNARFGEAPWPSVRREIAGDNVAGTWQTAVLKNGAGASFFIVAKEGQTVTAKQMEDILSQTERRLSREGAGRIGGSNLPVDFHKVSFSPDELALDKLPAHYESRICAAYKTPAMMLGYSAGEGTKTYSNMGEAIDDFWQRTMIPFQDRKGAELAAQLFPLFKMDPREWRFGFDRSQIAALQDDEGALYERVTKAVTAGWMTPNEAREKAKLPRLEGVDGANDLKGAPPATPVVAADATTSGTPESDDDEGAIKIGPERGGNWEESRHPRDDEGKWTSGNGNALPSRKPSSSVKSAWEEITDGAVDRQFPASPHPFKVAGRPVSQGFVLDKSATAIGLDRAFHLVDTLHGDGAFSGLFLRSLKKVQKDGVQGQLIRNERSGEVEGIDVRKNADGLILTTIHEIGHLIDLYGLPTASSFLDWNRPSHEQEPEWQKFHEAVVNSRAFKNLRQFEGQQTVMAARRPPNDQYGIRYDIDQKYVNYLLTPNELFARAYSQYVATRSGDRELRKQVMDYLRPGETRIGGPTPDSLKYPEYWLPSDFAPIAKAMDELFLNAKWIS